MASTLLEPLVFEPLPLGSIHPSGWLTRQLQIQADGLSGHLDEFWPDIQYSRWFGGTTEGWERAPYWLDGVIPLAFLLDDPELKAKISHFIDFIIIQQAEDGWLGPRGMVHAAGATETLNYDIWAQFLVLKVLVQFYDATQDRRVPGVVERCLRCIDRHIDTSPLFNWGQFRWFEALISIYWLYQRQPEAWLLDLAVKLNAQGFAWGDFFARWPLIEATPKGRWNFAGHVVNNAMAVKAEALWGRLTNDKTSGVVTADMIAKLDRYHGMVTGVFTGDECLAGKSPSQGTELCAVVEYAYSLETIISVLGDPVYGDRLEKIVFNALPATFSPDMWSHQYDQQVNQAECSIKENRTWRANGPDSNIFGLEPNYGCCTSNLSQGWPKFASSLWMRTADGGLAAVAYAPSRVQVKVGDVEVIIQLDTEYPFRDALHFSVTAAAPVFFPLLLRIPAWTQAASIQVEGQAAQQAQPGTFYRMEREWSGTVKIDLILPMQPALWQGYRGAVAVERGPLVYSLKMSESWQRVHVDMPSRELPHADWEVYPSAPWNYALALDDALVADKIRFSEHPLGEMPFSPEGAPVSAAVMGRRIPDWKLVNGSADDVPLSPVTSGEPLEELTLIPYGCTNLRITEFPLLKA